MDRMRNVDLRGRLKQEGVLDTVNKQHWKQSVEEMSTNRVTKIYDGQIQEDARKTQEKMEV